MNAQQSTNLTTQVCKDILRMIHKVDSGHPGGSLGCAEFLVCLYNEVVNSELSSSMDGEDEDLFFLSDGYISPIFCSVLAHRGFFPTKEPNTFRLSNSRLRGHLIPHEGLEGVHVASGFSGQGLSVTIGAALAKKPDDDKYLVYTLHGNGELQEGQMWKATIYAGGEGVDDLTAMVDYSQKQIDGPTDKVLPLGDPRAKWEASGWQVIDIEKGNDISTILKGLTEARALTGKGKSACVLLHIEMGNDVDFMVGTYAWYGKAPNDEQLMKTLAQGAEALRDY